MPSGVAGFVLFYCGLLDVVDYCLRFGSVVYVTEHTPGEENEPIVTYEQVTHEIIEVLNE